MKILATNLVLIFILFSGCAHPIVGSTNRSTIISYEGNQKNSSLLRINPDGSRVLTAGGRTRYNALIDLYGDQIGIAAHDEGMVSNPDGTEWTIDKEHWIKALRMNQWKRDGRQPSGTVKKLINKII